MTEKKTVFKLRSSNEGESLFNFSVFKSLLIDLFHNGGQIKYY